MKTAKKWIEELALAPHPEGGFYKRTEESSVTLRVNEQDRPLYTSIYFLLTPDSPSHFHRLQSDEVWYYHDGMPLTVHCLFPNGGYEAVPLGKAISEGQQLHFTVPKGTIFGSSVAVDYALVSCVVAPGFDFADFELFTQKDLLALYPQHEEIIKELAYVELP
ncbi:cupin domain-containing protein [Vagococcus salmoninarum]|uniref:cupin domain-containing protein n=1 Tax=Vagococcus salmoninarum TaxID=2739 RepID=UPI003F9CC980